MLWRSALRTDSTPVLGPRSRRKTYMDASRVASEFLKF
jgi:hypothetical protein